jgi:hypothetical protein
LVPWASDSYGDIVKNYLSFVIENRLNYNHKYRITDLCEMKFQSFEESTDSYFYVESLSNATFIHLLNPIAHQMYVAATFRYLNKVFIKISMLQEYLILQSTD